MAEGVASGAEQRTCRRCGCTEADCSGCVARTGEACTWVTDDLCSACVDLILPREMTPAIAEVLGMPNYRAGPVAHLFRAAGDQIKTRSEEEQAFILWRFLHLAILHGEQWHRFADADIRVALARAKAVKAKDEAS